MSVIRRALALFGIAATALVASCGGGDDGPDTIEVAYDVASVSKNLLLGSPGSVDLGVTLSSVPKQAAVVVVLIDRAGILSGSASVVQTGPNTFRATLSLLDTIPVGTHTGTLSFRLCRDVACASEHPLSGAALPYSIQVWPRVTIDLVQRGVTSHNAEIGSHPVTVGEQVTLISNVPVTWSKGSSITGNDLQNFTSTPTQWTGQIVGTPGGFVGVVAQSIAVGDAQQVIFDLSN